MRVYGNLDSINTQGRNLLINGDFQIDQRNAGAAKTINDSVTRLFGPDRWYGYATAANGVWTLQQVTASIPASGAKYAAKCTVTTPDALGAVGRMYALIQGIEGQTLAKLMWGTANAKSVTASFWIRSSLTGTFIGLLQNNAGDRAYVFTFTINVADTWEYKTVTIPGETSGTWLNTNGLGVWFSVSLGCGSNWYKTANTWSGSGGYGTTGMTQVISTNGATLYLADVQLEEGKEATAFERLHTDDVLRKCQRYYAILTSAFRGYTQASTYYVNGTIKTPVTMRSTPVVTRLTQGTVINMYDSNRPYSSALSPNEVEIVLQSAAGGDCSAEGSTWSAEAEL